MRGDPPDRILDDLARRVRERDDEAEAEAEEFVLPTLTAARREHILSAVGVSAVPPPSAVRRWAPMLAFAAGVLLTWGLVSRARDEGGPEEPVAVAPERAPAADSGGVPHTLELEGGRAVSLGAEDDAVRLHADDQVTLRMRPQRAASPERVMSLRLRDAQGTVVLRPAVASALDGGAIELRGRVGDVLPVRPGVWQLEVGIGPAEACEHDAPPCAWTTRSVELLP